MKRLQKSAARAQNSKKKAQKEFGNIKYQCCIYWIKFNAISDFDNFRIQLFVIDNFADDLTSAHSSKFDRSISIYRPPLLWSSLAWHNLLTD